MRTSKKISRLIRSKEVHRILAAGLLTLVLVIGYSYSETVRAIVNRNNVNEDGGYNYTDYENVPRNNIAPENRPEEGEFLDVGTQLTNGTGTVAGYRQVSFQVTNTLWYAWNRGLSYAPSSDTSVQGYATGLADPNITIGYDYGIYDGDSPSTLIPEGSTIPQGKKLILKFKPYVSDNIFWFGTGYSMDSPYGEWRDGAEAPDRSNLAVSCLQKDLTAQYTVGPTEYDVYIPFVVNPAFRKLSNVTGLTCEPSLTEKLDKSLTRECTATGSGRISPTFDYGETYGKFYYRYYDERDMSNIGWGGPGCYGNNIPMTTAYGGRNGPDAVFSSGIQAPYIQTIPAQSFGYPLVIGESGVDPDAPTLTCPSSAIAGQDISVTLKSIDPDGDQVKYGVNWQGDASQGVDSGWTPFVNSGTIGTLTKTLGFPTAGTRTIIGWSEDSKGATSPPASCTVIVVPALTASCSVSPTSIAAGDTATWTATASGGSGTYTYQWSGDDALEGRTGNPVSVAYSSIGPKYGSVTVRSGTQSKLVSCTNSVSVTNAANPDLTASNVTASDITGLSADLSAVVTNSGEAGTGAGFTNLFQRATSATGAGATDIGTYTSLARAVGAVSNISLAYTFPSAGTWYVRACADKSSAGSTGVIPESNEGNNCSANWTAITVGAAASLSCTVSPSSITPPGSATYTASGASAPYTWTGSDGGTYGTGSSINRSFSADATGSYGMTLSKSGFTSANCPVVTVGTPTCGIASISSFTSDKTRVRPGETVVLSYSATGVDTSCTISGTNMTSPRTKSATSCSVTDSFTTPGITTQSTYTLACDGDEDTETVIVNVVPEFDEF